MVTIDETSDLTSVDVISNMQVANTIYFISLTQFSVVCEICSFKKSGI